MRNLFLTVVLALFAFVSVDAQSIHGGVKLGYNYNSLKGKESLKDLQGKSGYHAGVYLEIPLNSSFSIQPEVLYVKGGAKNVYVQGDDLDTKKISIPVVFKYYLFKGLNVQFGPQVSFKTNSEYNFGKIDATELWKAVNKGDTTNGVDYGAVLGAGFRLPLKGLSVDARYVFGINNIVNKKDNGMEAVLKELGKDNEELKNGIYMIGVTYGF